MERGTFCLVLMCLALNLHNTHAVTGGMLYPRESEGRSIQDLSGMWNFRIDKSSGRNASMVEGWYHQKLSQTGPVISMPVPSSYNDITTDKDIREFVGWAWYDREFFVPSEWQDRRIVLRIDSAHYYSMVWVNGKAAMEHNGGHLPFEAEINNYVQFDQANLLTVAVNNTLTPHTIPPGYQTFQHDTSRFPEGYFTQTGQFDFFNYAGIHRRVRIYSTPKLYVDDITILTGFSGTSTYTGQVNYTVTQGGTGTAVSVTVIIRDRNGTEVARGNDYTGKLVIKNARLWWPYTQSKDFGYMYTMEVRLVSNEGTDVYRQPFGIRTVRTTETQLLINEKPFYCHGAAKHEDSDIRGKGLDFPLIARDFQMMKWLGVNCFRTSHYPYAEEIMDQADEQGIVVIDECPAVGLKVEENFSNITLEHHKEVLEELVRRDKNRPSAIIWSVANEPNSASSYSETYFKTVIEHVKQLDNQHRPVTFVSDSQYSVDRAAQFTDIQCINKYYAWYSDIGHIEVIQLQLKEDFQGWFDKFKKPLMISEYGADTVYGFHTAPTQTFTEDYQAEFLHEYHKGFDYLRSKFLVGEMVWNFADFMTDENVIRAMGNRKGVLTRQREPKFAAHILRQRYWSIINQTLPSSESHDALTKSAKYAKLFRNVLHYNQEQPDITIL